MLVLVVLIWGTAFPLITEVERALDPFQLTWYRYLPFPILYGAYLLSRRSAVFASVAGRDWIVMLGLGAIGVIGYHFPLNWAMDPHRAGALSGAAGAIIIATTPLWTMLLAVVVRKERYNARAALGTLVAFGGVGLVIGLGQEGGAAGGIPLAASAVVALLAPIAWAIYSVYTKPLIAKYGGLFVTGVTLSLGTFTLIPLGLQYGVAPLADLDGLQWFALAFLALLSTALGYALWNNALKHRAASSVAAYVYFNPVVATIVAVFFFQARLTLFFLVGGALVILGVYLVNRARALATVAPGPTSEAVKV